jgi:adenylylsulfate kinase
MHHAFHKAIMSQLEAALGSRLSALGKTEAESSNQPQADVTTVPGDRYHDSMLVIMAGLPGSGKSALARALAPRCGGVVLDKDPIRATLFGAEVEYTTEQDDFVVNIMLQTAAWFLARNRQRVVILDGRVFSRHAQLHRVTDFAEKLSLDWIVFECVCAEQTARRRLEQDVAAGVHPAQNRTYALYQAVKKRFEPIPEPKVVVDTERSLEECVDQALDAVTRYPLSVSRYRSRRETGDG